MTTTPTPPKGRRWLDVGEIIRKYDRFHPLKGKLPWVATAFAGERVGYGCFYSRAIRRKTTRK